MNHQDHPRYRTTYAQHFAELTGTQTYERNEGFDLRTCARTVAKMAFLRELTETIISVRRHIQFLQARRQNTQSTNDRGNFGRRIEKWEKWHRELCTWRHDPRLKP